MYNYLRYIRTSHLCSMTTFTTLSFDNQALKKLPVDVEERNFVRQVNNACFSLVKPQPILHPEMVVFSKSAANLIGLASEIDSPTAVEYFSGNQILPGAQTAAHCYCGHQFGNFAGQLGDGATMYIGEIINSKNERWEIQYKGAGQTPYSREADGRKVLRSSIREFLCSEALYFLGIPTTRAATCITSDTLVIRDIFYSGNPKNEKATVITRIAPTFIRFGSFEIFNPLNELTGRIGPSYGNVHLLTQLLDYVIEFFYSDIWLAHKEDKQIMYLEFFKEIVRRTACLVAEWQSIGFCHGVLNTDNMSIVGLTIDYGPFGFMDSFDRKFVCNASDNKGRYSYENQPEICKWNCGKLAEALSPVINLDKTKSILETTFDINYRKHYMDKMRKKLGLLRRTEMEDDALVESFLNTLEKTGGDFTNSWRALSVLTLESTFNEQSMLIEKLTSLTCSLESLRSRFLPRIDPRQLAMLRQIAATQPGILEIIGGTDILQQEIANEENLSKLTALNEEEKKSADRVLWSDWVKLYAARVQREIIEDAPSSADVANHERRDVMLSNNPRIVLRNYLAQRAIDAAEKGDFSEVRRLFQYLQKPYDEEFDEHTSDSVAARHCFTYDAIPPTSARLIRVT